MKLLWIKSSNDKLRRKAKFIIYYKIRIHTENFDQTKFTEFLKSTYQTFEDFERIEFFLKTENMDHSAKLMEAMIHRYCRSIGYDRYEIHVVNDDQDADVIYK